MEQHLNLFFCFHKQGLEWCLNKNAQQQPPNISDSRRSHYIVLYVNGPSLELCSSSLTVPATKKNPKTKPTANSTPISLRESPRKICAHSDETRLLPLTLHLRLCTERLPCSEPRLSEAWAEQLSFSLYNTMHSSGFQMTKEREIGAPNPPSL